MRSAIIIAALFAAACSASAIASNPGWGVNLSDQDRSVRPGDNFAMYQNGAWFKRTTLTDHQANAAYWRDLRIAANQRVADMLTDLGNGERSKLNPQESLVAAFERSSRDEATVDRKGLAPLEPRLAAIRNARDKTSFAELMGRIEGPGTLREPSVRPERGHDFFLLAITQDLENPSRYVVSVQQGGLLLPGPEYYVDPSFADIKAAYQTYVANMLRLLHWRDPGRSAADVVNLETAIAKVSSSHEDLTDPSKTFHRMTLAQLVKVAPAFPWAAYLKGAGVPRNAPLAIDVPSVAQGIASVYAHASLAALQAKQAFGAAHVDAARLSSPVYQEYRRFAVTALAGIQAGPSRDLDAVNLVEASVPDAVGAVYVQRYSSPAIKAKVQEMARLMKTALSRRIGDSASLSPAGKAAAQKKLDSLDILVGYPDRFDAYPDLKIDESDFYGNVSRSAAHAWNAQVRKLNQPISRAEWTLTPFYPQYNYNPVRNAVEIPAALLVPPFFNADADDAVNYGADGTVIGAQIVASLFSSGAAFDAAGKLRSWLPAADQQSLEIARHKVADLYSREEPLPGMRLKGELLANEALEDIGGMQIALDAYHASLGEKEPPVLDGYTGDQRFFLGRAQMWRAKFSPEFTRNQVATGSNAPPYVRINGPLPNLDAWYGAFKVEPDHKLYIPPEQRVHLW
jgi:putative endopeptidase